MADERDEPASGLRNSFRAFRNRGFLIFWLSAVVSNSGTWLSNLTVPFVLYQVTGNAIWVGYAAVAQYVPLVLIGPWGGALADRMSRVRDGHGVRERPESAELAVIHQRPGAA